MDYFCHIALGIYSLSAYLKYNSDILNLITNSKIADFVIRCRPSYQGEFEVLSRTALKLLASI